MLVSTAVGGLAQNSPLAGWTRLIDANKCVDAEKLCRTYVNSPNLSEQVEAQKCLANTALCGHDVVVLQGDNSGGGTLSGGYTPEAVDQALAHLNAGIKLAPQDLSIHQGRLHVLEVSLRYDAMVKALDESCSLYQGKDALQAWLAYAPELADLRQAKAGVSFMQVLDRHYPNNPDVIANIGAFLMMEKKPQEALAFLEKAAQMAPRDPINAWDLGKAYDLTNQTALADDWYQKGLSLQTDKDELRQNRCLYGHFVGEKLHDMTRACSLEKADCDPDDRPACKSSPQGAAPPGK